MDEFKFPDHKTVIAVGGPPHSGKSVFLAELYRQMLANPQIGSRVFLQRTCPDGEGMWSAEADQDLVKKIRVKGDFSPEAMNFFLQSIDGLRRSKDIVLADLGGMISLENVLIMAHCSDLIILSSKEAKARQWAGFAGHLDEIARAIKQRDIGALVEFQKQGLVDIVPPTKLEQFSTDEVLQVEISRRLEILHSNLPEAVAQLPEHKVNVMAELGSRLLVDEQRTEVDETLSRGEVLPESLSSKVETGELPWQGEMVDLDRDRGSETYQGAISKISEGLAHLNQERLAELQAEREGGLPKS